MSDLFKHSLSDLLACGYIENRIGRKVPPNLFAAAVTEPDSEIGVSDFGQGAIRVLIGFNGFAKYLLIIEYEGFLAVWCLELVVGPTNENRNLQIDMMVTGVCLGYKLIDSSDGLTIKFPQ
jgi:hypothetical protein